MPEMGAWPLLMPRHSPGHGVGHQIGDVRDELRFRRRLVEHGDLYADGYFALAFGWQANTERVDDAAPWVEQFRTGRDLRLRKEPVVVWVSAHIEAAGPRQDQDGGRKDVRPTQVARRLR